MNEEVHLSHQSFYNEYHGHKERHLLLLTEHLRSKKSGDGLRSGIYLAGDSSLDNKFWFENTASALNGYEDIIKPPVMKKDVAYWLNYELKRRGIDQFCINCAVEESSVGSRACCRLLPQDKVIRDTITEEDILVVSIGGNDIVLRPNLCTIFSTLALTCCTTNECVKSSCGCALPCDDYTCGCSTGCLSNCLGFPCGYGYFLHLFGTRIQSYIDRLTSKKRPKIIMVCMIYYPDEAHGQSWAETGLSVLGYNENPSKLQSLINRVFEDATQRIKVEGSRVIGVPLFRALNGKISADYSARVEPSAQGGSKMASLILDALTWGVMGPGGAVDATSYGDRVER